MHTIADSLHFCQSAISGRELKMRFAARLIWWMGNTRPGRYVTARAAFAAPVLMRALLPKPTAPGVPPGSQPLSRYET